MCEILALQSAQPFALGTALEYGRSIEHFGVAGFGWGVSWVMDGELYRYRSPLGLAQDEAGLKALSERMATSCLLHLRRPSFLSTIALENSQPYLSGDGTPAESVMVGELAFVHNGYLANQHKWRDQFADILEGQSDSEVGFRLYVQRLAADSHCEAMERTACDAMGEGEANLVALDRNETLVALGRNERNPLYRFTGQNFSGVVTSLHSLDTFVFDEVLPWIEERQQITDCVLIPGPLSVEQKVLN